MSSFKESSVTHSSEFQGTFGNAKAGPKLAQATNTVSSFQKEIKDMKLFQVEESVEFEKGLNNLMEIPPLAPIDESTRTYIDYELTQTQDEQSCVGKSKQTSVQASVVEERKLEKLAEEARLAEEDREAEEKRLAAKAKSNRESRYEL